MLEEAVTLADKERQRAKELLRDFKDIIALSDDDLGRNRLLYLHCGEPPTVTTSLFRYRNKTREPECL